MTQEEAIRCYQRREEVEVSYKGSVGTGKITSHSGTFFTFRGMRKGLGGGRLEFHQIPPSAFSRMPIRVA